MNGQDARSEILCVGEMLWDLHVPAGTPLIAANHVSFEPGGSATNVARHLVKQGIRAGVVGVVGEDALGTALVERIAREGVDVHNVVKMRARTGLVLISNDPAVAIAYRAADEEGQAFRQAIKGDYKCRIMHFSNLLPDRTAIHALTRAAQRARTAGSVVVVDANLRPRLWRADAVAKTNPFELLKTADVLKLSIDDMQLLGIDDPEVFREELEDHAILILTRGTQPTQAWSSRGSVSVPVVKLDIPIAVGAGDAFSAGCLSTMLDMPQRMWGARNELEGIVAHGNAVARAYLEQRLSSRSTP